MRSQCLMQVLKQHRGNMFAANGIGILYAEKAQWDIAKELFTQVRGDYYSSFYMITVNYEKFTLAI